MPVLTHYQKNVGKCDQKSKSFFFHTIYVVTKHSKQVKSTIFEAMNLPGNGLPQLSITDNEDYYVFFFGKYEDYYVGESIKITPYIHRPQHFLGHFVVVALPVKFSKDKETTRPSEPTHRPFHAPVQPRHHRGTCLGAKIQPKVVLSFHGSFFGQNFAKECVYTADSLTNTD